GQDLGGISYGKMKTDAQLFVGTEKIADQPGNEFASQCIYVGKVNDSSSLSGHFLCFSDPHIQDPQGFFCIFQKDLSIFCQGNSASLLLKQLCAKLLLESSHGMT